MPTSASLFSPSMMATLSLAYSTCAARWKEAACAAQSGGNNSSGSTAAAVVAAPRRAASRHALRSENSISSTHKSKSLDSCTQVAGHSTALPTRPPTSVIANAHPAHVHLLCCKLALHFQLAGRQGTLLEDLELLQQAA